MTTTLLKKKAQLGMHPSTASARLLKDILFELIVIKDDHKCHQCGGELTRDTFSIEHKEPWMDSEDPLGNFFDLDNIAFSHLVCNVGASRKPNRKYDTIAEKRQAERERSKLRWANLSKEERQENRRERYIKHGE